MRSWKKWLVCGMLLTGAVPAFGQSASLLPNGKQVFLDSNGVPLAGGNVYFYIPSTTTPKTTWSDPGESTPNANPVVLDSAGRGIIYGSGQYRELVRDQYGNTIWDQLTFGSPGISAATFGTATGNTPGDPVCMANSTTGLVDCGPSLSPSVGGKPINRFTSFAFTSSWTPSAGGTPQQMGGFGSSWKLTPATTGNIRLEAVVNVACPSGTQMILNAYHGTGTAPAQGAAITGTAIFAANYGINSSTATSPTQSQAVLRSEFPLTLGTNYWFDLGGSSFGGTGCSAIVLSVTIEEF